MQIPFKGNKSTLNHDLADNMGLPVSPPTPKILKAKDYTIDATGTANILPAADLNAAAARAVVQNIGGKSCTITNGTLTSGNGLLLAAGESVHICVSTPPGAICASAETTTVRVVQLG